MEILFERRHHEYRRQRLRFPEVEWRCRVVIILKKCKAKTR